MMDLPLLSLGSQVVPDWAANLSLAEQSAIDGLVEHASSESHFL